LKKPSVTFEGSAASPKQFPTDGLPEVAFLGRSNVGKSRLLNALAGTDGLARVSARPGRTQLVNFFRMDDSLYFVDLPGYGYARVPERVRSGFEALVTSYLRREAVVLGVFLVDIRHEPTEDDQMLRGFLDQEALPYVVAATKADKIGRGELARRRQDLVKGLGRTALGVIPTSAEDGTGVAELFRAIRQAAEAGSRAAATSGKA
jgi:GTP-binding protein